MDHNRYQTAVIHLTAPCMPFSYSYHILTSSVISRIATAQHGTSLDTKNLICKILTHWDDDILRRNSACNSPFSATIMKQSWLNYMPKFSAFLFIKTQLVDQHILCDFLSHKFRNKTRCIKVKDGNIWRLFNCFVLYTPHRVKEKFE